MAAETHPVKAGRPSQMNEATVAAVMMTPSRYYAGADSRVYADFPPQLGYPGGLLGVPIMGGGGVAARYAQVGRILSVDAFASLQLPQVLVLFVGTERRPVAMEPVSAPATILPVTSHGTVNGGSAWQHDASGNMTAGLGDAGTLTVSRGGEADGRLVLRDELVGYLEALVAQLNIMLGRIAVVEAAIPIPPPIPSVTFPDPNDYTLGAAVLPVASDAE